MLPYMAYMDPMGYHDHDFVGFLECWSLSSYTPLAIQLNAPIVLVCAASHWSPERFRPQQRRNSAGCKLTARANLPSVAVEPEGTGQKALWLGSVDTHLGARDGDIWWYMTYLENPKPAEIWGVKEQHGWNKRMMYFHPCSQWGLDTR